MMRTFHKNFWAVLLLAAASATLLSPAEFYAQPAALEPAQRAQIDVVKHYLQAIHARDAGAAYRTISFLDRNLRGEKTYIQSQDNFSAFALDFARRLAADMEVWVIEQNVGSTKARLEVGYRVPTGDEIAPQLFDWNTDKLNSLSAAEQAALIAAWEKLKKNGKLITIEGRETFDLVLENDGWKIFLDWRSRHRVVFKTSQARPAELAVKFLSNDFLVKSEVPFQVDFQVANRTDRDIVVKLNHLFEPRRIERNIDMIACGSLLPLRLRPQETQNISSSYLLRGNLPARTQLAIIYDFAFAPRAAKQKLSQVKDAKNK
jgi:hypothetical protein